MLGHSPMAEVLDGESLEDAIRRARAAGATAVAGMEWLQSFSD